MRVFRIIQIFGAVFCLSIAHANAVQINLSGDYIDRYFRILEDYVLPLMVVSTIVLFCGYLASRVYHRTVTRKEPGRDEDNEIFESPEEGTAAFLRELKATPPIEDQEPKREPRLRAQHPLLRKRAVNAAAVLRSRGSDDDAPRAPRTETVPVAGIELHLPLSREHRESRNDRAPQPQAPRIATPQPDEPKGVAPQPPQPPQPPQAPRMAETRAEAPRPPAAPEKRPDIRPNIHPGSRDAADQRLDVVAPSNPPARDREAGDSRAPTDRMRAEPLREQAASEAAHPRTDPPPVATNPAWWQEAGSVQRLEPSASVVQALKKSPSPVTPSPDLEAARARAGEIVDSLDYITSVLQQANTLVADRIKRKQGLELDDVRGMRVTGFDEPQGVLEDLRKLGGDVATEVLSTYTAVAKFNNILRRLEQMAESEPLDEGWNDLLRARMSEMLFVIGQVRKTLGGYRRGAKKPANAADKPERSGGASGSGPEQPLPFGRRQI